MNAKQQNHIVRMTCAQLAIALLAALASPAWADSTIVPDPTITPGAIRTVDSADICSHGTHELRHWDRARDDRIMAEYGLPTGPHPDFEIDHLSLWGSVERTQTRISGPSRGGRSNRPTTQR